MKRRGSRAVLTFGVLAGWSVLLACGSDARIVYIDCDVVVPPPAEPVEAGDLEDAALEAEADAPFDAGRDAPGHSVVVKDADPDAPWAPASDTFPQNGAYDIAFESADTVYVASARGVFKSTDVGRVWVPKNDGLLVTNTEGARAIAADPTSPGRLYFASRYDVGRNYVFTSNDGAEHWTAVDVSYPTRREYQVQKLLVDPTLGVMIAAKQAKAPYAPVFLTRDDAGGFRASVVVDPGDAGEDFTKPTALVGDAKDLFFEVQAGTVGTGGTDRPGGIFHSTDGGETWTESDEGIAPEHKPLLDTLARSPSTPTTLYATCAIYPPSSPAVYKSTDNGAHWSRIGSGYPTDDSWVTTLAVHPTNPDVVYAGFLYGDVYKSTNGGTDWGLSHARRRQFDSSALFIAFRPGDPRTLFVGTNELLIVTRNGGGEP